MVKHIELKDLKILKEEKPEIIFYSQAGACGDSGLILIMLDKQNFFVANSRRSIHSKEYENLIKETVRCVPELDPLGLQINGEEHKARKGYRFIYYGLGNAAFIRDDIFDVYKLNTYKEFFEFIGEYAGNFHKISINKLEEETKW